MEREEAVWGRLSPALLAKDTASGAPIATSMESHGVDTEDAQLIRSVLSGDTGHFETILRKYQPRVFATARRYARAEQEVEDIVQEVFIKAFQKLSSFRGEAPFEHWLMRLTVRTCYDHLRARQRRKELTFTELAPDEADWLERFSTEASSAREDEAAARTLVYRLMDQLSAPARLVIQLLEIEGRSIKEISTLTGWSIPLVKVRAFRARGEMRKALRRLVPDRYW
jgi:RNA polymerase sigma-70 factor (ECF subfamily)